MTKLLTTLLILLISVTLFAEIMDTTRQRLTPEEFQIIPWGIKWTNMTDMDLYFQEMYDCGFNLTNFIGPEDVEIAKKHNLKSIIQKSSLIDESIADYKERGLNYAKKIAEAVGEENMDNVYYIYVRDEPTANENTKEYLSAFSDAIREATNAKPYINLYPDYANEVQLGTNSYADYLDYFTQACKLDYISYDHYAFSLGAAPDVPGMTYNEGGAGFNENGFYGNLEAVKAAADRNNVKFVNIIQSVGALHWPDPDDYIIHVQGWSTLAYGGRGLSYFTYNTPNLGNWRNAPFDEFGMKSPTYRHVAHMNFAIHNVGNIYKTLKNINVYHVGNVPKGCKDSSSAVNIAELNLHTIKGEPNVVVGEFVDPEGNPYAIIVNKDPKYSVSVGIKFKKEGNIYKVEDRSIGGEVKGFGGEDRYIMPGHGVILFTK